MTNHAFLPEAILKELTATDDYVFTGFINSAYLLSMELDDLNSGQENLYNMVDKECWLANSDNMNNVTDVEKFVPWFLSCNPHRCPLLDRRTRSKEQGPADINERCCFVSEASATVILGKIICEKTFQAIFKSHIQIKKRHGSFTLYNKGNVF